MSSDPKSKVIRDGRFFNRDGTGWSVLIAGILLSWTKASGGWSFCLHKLIKSAE